MLIARGRWQTEDAKAVRDAQKRFTQKYLAGLKENKQLKQDVAELSARHERTDAEARVQAASLAEQLQAAEATAAIDVHDMTENVLELESKLKRTEQRLAEALAERGSDAVVPQPEVTAQAEAAEAAEAAAEAERESAAEAALTGAKQEAQRLGEELEIAMRQHAASQQAIQSLERRVRELEDERRAATVSPAVEEPAPVPAGTPVHIAPTLSAVIHTPTLAAVPRASVALETSTMGVDTVSPTHGLEIGIPQQIVPVRERQLRTEPCKSGALKKHSKGKFAKDGQRHVQLFDWELWYQKNECNLPAALLDQPKERETAEAAKIELEHARCIADVESDCVFHMLTQERAYSFAAATNDERQAWTRAICPCIHDAALVQASALDRTSQQAGYLVLASRTGRGKNRRMDLDMSKWKLQWWSLSEDDTLDCHRGPPIPVGGGAAAAADDTEQSYDLLGAEVAQSPSPGDLPPSFEVTLSGTKSGKTVAAGGEKLRLFCTDEAELHRWLLRLQSAIKRSRDPGCTKKGFLLKESQAANSMDHKRWFVVKSGVMRVYSKSTDATWDTLDEFDLRDATVGVTDRAVVKPGHFVLRTAHKTIGLVAADYEEQQRWIEVLQKNIDAIEPDDVAQLTQQGYLQKRSSGLVAEKTEPRWFTLHHGRLSCFKHEKDSKPRWSLDLTEHSYVALENSGTSSLGFTINTATASDHKVVALTAANAHDLDVWVSALQSVIAAATVRARERGPKKPSTKRGRSPSCPNVLDLDAKGAEHVTAMLVIKGEAESIVPVKRRPRLKTRDLTAKMQEEHGAAAREQRLAKREPRITSRRSSCGFEVSTNISRGVPQPPLGQYTTSVVIDLGSQFIRAGFSGELAPRVVVPTTMMTTAAAAEAGLQLTTETFGWEAEELLSQAANANGGGAAAQAEAILPRGNGSARTAAQEVDWYGTVLPMLRYVFQQELQVDPEQYHTVLILPTCMSTEDKEDLVDVMFDDLKVPKLTLQPTGPLALGAARTGGATGLVLSWGNSLQITPVCDCTILRDKERTVRFGGEEVTAFLAQLLETERGVSLRRDGLSLDHSNLRKLKEQYAYVADDFAAQKAECSEQVCALGTQQHTTAGPTTASGGSGNGGGSSSSSVQETVTLDAELFTCAELLFNPGLGGHDYAGVHEMIADVLAECPIDYRKDLSRHIVIVGGNTCFPGAIFYNII